ncbi:hypothetical protein BKA59DRAFT_460654 [Fusarium tricinctum]|uniref:Uncharacterized protein n=1 Tax=Fusarium tricinctum TaxID=61284 RepID=A0A8K0RIM5_9HYPO|nr:hypothetical protein BKA59DRAFT_460654 [Fusarium tricinctum]
MSREWAAFHTKELQMVGALVAIALGRDESHKRSKGDIDRRCTNVETGVGAGEQSMASWCVQEGVSVWLDYDPIPPVEARSKRPGWSLRKEYFELVALECTFLLLRSNLPAPQFLLISTANLPREKAKAKADGCRQMCWQAGKGLVQLTPAVLSFSVGSSQHGRVLRAECAFA